MGKIRFRDFLRRNGITRIQVSDFVGVSVQTVSYWVNRSDGIGRTAMAPNRVNAKKLQEFVSKYEDIDIDDFFYTD
jgi:transposase